MKAMSFTPGPWTVTDFAPPIVIEANREDEVWCVAEVGNGEMPSREEEANARLIAAAPELLEALQYFKRHISGDASCDLQTLLHMTDAAIAKATAK